MSEDEKQAQKCWKEYHKAVVMALDMDDLPSTADAFFAGFYSGRDYERDKYE